MSEIASIAVERDDRKEDHGMSAVQGIIVNPMGKLPKGAFEQVNKKVQSKFDKDDLRDGEKRRVGEIEYEPSKDGEIIDIRLP